MITKVAIETVNKYLCVRLHWLLFVVAIGISSFVSAQDVPRDTPPQANSDSQTSEVERRGRGRSGLWDSRAGRRGGVGGNYGNRSYGDPGDDAFYDQKWEMGFIKGEFSFARLQYDNRFARGDFGFGFDTWATDYDAADRNFLRGVSRLTNVQVKPEPVVMRLDNDDIFDYPFLYALEMGRGGVHFSDKEMQNLREYLLRGGFLLIDDFWGTWQWDNFYQTFSQVFPDRELVELKSDHDVFHVFYDIDGPQMIPAISNPNNVPEEDVAYASNFAVLDDDGRVMVLINWNSDMGDGWEHTYHPAYPTKFANQAYQLGINYLIYAMTH